MNDLVTLGQRIRHFRTSAGMTLDQLGDKVGIAGSQLSLMENGRREPRLSLLGAIATATGIQLADLLDDAPPSKRAALEIELDRAQRSSVYASLGLPSIRPSKGTADETLEALVGLHRELARRAREAIATPEEARRANTDLRLHMRTLDNYLPDIDDVAEKLLADVGHTTGALTHRSVSMMAERLGFELVHVNDLPHSARSVTDLANGRIYLPPASIPGGHGLRGMALQAMAHRVLGHETPATYADFLRQRLEINYFAAAVLMPRRQSVEFLSAAKADRNIAVEDFRDAFGVTHEAAALRFTNLATAHLDLEVHFLRVGDDGAVYKAYENDGLRLPVDVTGSTEGRSSAASGVRARRSPAPTARPSSTSTPTPRRAPSSTRPRREPRRPRSSPSRSAFRSRTRSGSAVARRATALRRPAPTSHAAARPTAPSPSAGRARPGRVRGCTRTSCRRCRRGPSPGSTIASSTSSSRRTPSRTTELARREGARFPEPAPRVRRCCLHAASQIGE